MPPNGGGAVVESGAIGQVWDTIRRAFAEFLAFPSLIIAAFLLLAGATFALDRSHLPWLEPVRDRLQRFMSSPDATAALLGTIAGSLITVTSITISLLLVAVQQAAGMMTAQVFDQFLRRRHNQFHFGFFVGLSLFALLTLASVDESFNPVLGAATVMLLTVLALVLLIVLLYATIDQMRPIEIIEMIHDQTLLARQRQRHLLKATGASARRIGKVTATVHASRHGFVTGIDVPPIRGAATAGSIDAEVILRVAIGSFVAWGDVVADVHASSPHEAQALVEATRAAIHLERQRDITVDPGYGIAQLETIAWTSISTSKSDPAPGILTVYALRDLLGRWAAETGEREGRAPDALVTYADDTDTRLMDAFETLAVVASESMQHQSLIAVLRALAGLLDRLPPAIALRAEDIIRRILPSLGDHVLTADLDRALSDLHRALVGDGRTGTAAALGQAHTDFAATIGHFGSRSTRGERRGNGVATDRRGGRA